MGCSHDCSSCSSDCKSKNSESLRESLNQYSSVKKVIAVVLQARQFQRLLALTKEQRATNTELFLLQPKRELILCQ